MNAIRRPSGEGNAQRNKRSQTTFNNLSKIIHTMKKVLSLLVLRFPLLLPASEKDRIQITYRLLPDGGEAKETWVRVKLEIPE